ncbi:hypothetical protein KDA23_01315 [Candidatus Saccharibacteria bacterium]|nr:hypothetical protein [Candidatus Saccharibacteria bacterium]
MPPQQPYTPQTPPQPGNERYDFIMSPEQPKRSVMPSLGNPKSLLFIVGVVAVVVILLVVVLGAVRGGGIDKTPYVAIAQQQQEIIRVAGLQEQNLTNQDVKNFVVNTELSLASDQQTFYALLGRNKIKVSEKQLALGQNNATDAALQNAQDSSTLNQALPAELRKELESYQASIQQAYQAAGPFTRQVLLELYNNAALLIKQSK